MIPEGSKLPISSSSKAVSAEVCSTFASETAPKQKLGAKRRFEEKSFRSKRKYAGRLPVAAAVLALLVPSAAWCCGGFAGNSIAVTSDGTKFTVTNIGREVVSVRFTTAYDTYDLILTPGQSAQPRQPGIFGQFMSGYQSCVATPLPSR